MLKAQGVGKSYGNEQILSDVELELHDGEILGLVGESGCGKSTLARVLCCYERPSQGRIMYQEQNMNDAGRKALMEFRKNCQMILQDSLTSLDPTMTVGKTLHETLKYNSNLSFSQRKEKIEQQLASVFLDAELLDRFPVQLSGGERQRMNIARALLVEPSILICDEITSSLDVITQYRLLIMLKKLNQSFGLPLIFISHDIDAVKSISDRILVMHKGKIVEELEKSKNFEYSGKYAKRLFESLPIHHPSKREELVSSFEEI